MSTIDEIKKLEEQRNKLVNQAKKEAIQQAEQAIKTLQDLGFTYELVESDKTTRRSGIRQQVLSTIQKHPKGIDRQALFTALHATDKHTKQSISNAVSALKKAEKITADGGQYKAI